MTDDAAMRAARRFDLPPLSTDADRAEMAAIIREEDAQAQPAQVAGADDGRGSMSEAREHVDQHIAWLAGYIELMTESNWRDMRLHCERQLDELRADLAKERGA